MQDRQEHFGVRAHVSERHKTSCVIPRQQPELGWSITGSPPWSYNHEAPSDDAFSFSLGIGVGKTAIFAGRPWKLSAQYWHFIEKSSTFGASDQIRVSIGPVINLPWGG